MTARGRRSAYLASSGRASTRALDALLPQPPACPQLIADAMRYSLMAGGKRLRPCSPWRQPKPIAGPPGPTTRAAARGERSLPAACAVEMIHTYSLIHDDLPAMDDDTLRRGRPTTHVVFGDGIAILAGDGLLTEAFALLAREPDARGRQRTRVAQAARRRARGHGRGRQGMVGGQAIDLQRPGTSSVASLDGRGARRRCTRARPAR